MRGDAGEILAGYKATSSAFIAVEAHGSEMPWAVAKGDIATFGHTARSFALARGSRTCRINLLPPLSGHRKMVVCFKVGSDKRIVKRGAFNPCTPVE